MSTDVGSPHYRTSEAKHRAEGRAIGELLDATHDAEIVLRMADRSAAWKAERDRVIERLDKARAGVNRECFGIGRG